MITKRRITPPTRVSKGRLSRKFSSNVETLENASEREEIEERGGRRRRASAGEGATAMT